MEYDFIVSPGGDPSQIGLAFDGADALEIDQQGDLVLSVGGRQVRMNKPVLYQETPYGRRAVAGRFLRQAAYRVGFVVTDYDREQTLVIDPALAYSSYLGGSGDDGGLKIAADFEGNVYVTGGTGSVDFPGTGAGVAGGGPW